MNFQPNKLGVSYNMLVIKHTWVPRGIKLIGKTSYHCIFGQTFNTLSPHF